MIGEVTFKVPWEALPPGPVGEYLEVIDIDPASGCFYEPVNLDDPSLLAQNGLRAERGHAAVPPADGLRRREPDHPQFRARARPPQPVAARPAAAGQGSQGRLASRPAPARLSARAARGERLLLARQDCAAVRLLPAPPRPPRPQHVPGGMVFTCLSHDIIAHETTHALLDGMHRRYLTSRPIPTSAPSTRPSPTSSRCSSTSRSPRSCSTRSPRHAATLRTQESLLGQLAGQFGRALGRRGALRDAIGTVDPDTGTGSRAHPTRPPTRPRSSRTNAARFSSPRSSMRS